MIIDEEMEMMQIIANVRDEEPDCEYDVFL